VSQAYHCWIPDWEDDEDGRDVEAYSAQSAAQDYCDRRFMEIGGGSWPGSVNVNVREPGLMTQYEVTIEWSPSFHATALRLGPRVWTEWERELYEKQVGARAAREGNHG
jgi:hypothetical protein